MFGCIVLTLSLLFSLTSAITHGTDVTPDEQKLFPYQASIRFKNPHNQYNNGFICSGTLITHQHILTSAKCFYNSSDLRTEIHHPSEYRIVLGNIYRERPFKTLLERDVSAIYVSKSFTRTFHDLAILKMAEPIARNAISIAPVKLRNESLPVNTQCVVTGWGETSEEAVRLSDVLVKGTLTVVADEMCKSLYEGETPEGFLCFIGDQQDICGGDLGAPVICDGEMVGFVSKDGHCGRGSKHVIVTSVIDPMHHEWIQRNGSWVTTVNYLVLILSSLPMLIR